MYANIPNTTRKAVYRRDGYRCALCDSSQSLQIHHVVPRGEGGTDSPQNLITLCSYCHSHVHGRPLYETPMTAADIDQACVEYLADLYAPDWNPWAKGKHPLDGVMLRYYEADDYVAGQNGPDGFNDYAYKG